MCRACAAAYRKEKYHKRKNAPKGSLPSIARCAMCKKDKPRHLFSTGCTAAGLNSYCKTCTNIRAKEYRSGPKGKASSMLANARSRAKRKGLEFSLTLEATRAVVDAGHCEATGLPFDLYDAGSPYSPSIDRKDSSLGYTPENTWVVITAFNRAKNEWSVDLLIEIVKAYEKHQG